ncbi:MAG: sulfite exporter TauE/SafE family protein, partial [Pseudomonas sp.]|nr:sulfite exporter TauE/SafE family protein [Pseudomonas sp.]
AMAGIAITSMFFARFGARLAHKLSPRLLKRLFALLLFSVGLSFLL